MTRKLVPSLRFDDSVTKLPSILIVP